MRQNAKILFSAQDATANPFNSGKIDMRNSFGLSLVMTSSNGANAGAVKFQGSNDETSGDPAAFAPTTWVDVPSTEVYGSGTVAAGATVTIGMKQCGYMWVRCVWTPSAGAGTITGSISTQGF